MAKFSKRHYIAIAETLGELIATQNLNKFSVVSAFVDLFTEDNIRFDEDRFINKVDDVTASIVTETLTLNMLK